MKYLVSMGIKPIVVYDRDGGVPGSEIFNEPINEAVNGDGIIIQMHENVEDEIGYKATYEKPFKAYQQTLSWGETWLDIPENWRNKIKEIFQGYIQE